jgi:hypothetical protein
MLTIVASETSQTASSPSTNSQSGSDSQTTAPPTTSGPQDSVVYNTRTIVSGGKTITSTGTHTITPTPSSSGPAKSSSSPTFAATLPAGGISLISPPVISGPQYYKVGDNVTFVFGYTNVLATPSAVNVLAAYKQQTFTMATNHRVPNETGTVIWDTGKYQATAASDPLLTAMYTLIIYDSSSTVTGVTQPGYLAAYEQYQFGMYLPQVSTPLPAYKCATCSGAFGDMERMALTTALGMGVITVLSFTWFVGGLAITW